MASAVRKEVIDAFKSVGIDDDKAWKAAEALADPAEKITKIEGRLDLLTCMIGMSIALNVAILIKLLVS